MSDSEDNIENIEETIEEKSTKNEDIEELTSSIQCGKKSKPRTEKQLAALEKARATRKANALKKKQLEEDNQKLEEENKKYLKKIVDDAHKELPEKQHYVPKNKTKKKTKIIYADDSEPSDEEVIIVKKRPKKKKAPPKKKIIYESSSSESEDEEPQFEMDNLTQPQKKQVHYQEQPQYQYTTNRPLKYSDLINYG